MLLMRFTLHPDIWTIFKKLIIIYFDDMVSQIYPSELQLKANTSIIEAALLDLHLICQFLMILFLRNFIIKVTTLILKLSIFHF